MYDFAYQKPSSLADAVKALGADPEAKALAGGMTLIPVLKQRLNKPTVVVDLAKLGLVGITVSRRHSDHRRDDDARRRSPAMPEMKAKIPALAELASHDRRRGGAPSRHDRRQPGEQRSGRRLSRRAAGAWRDDQDRPALDQGGRLLPGHVHDGAGAGRDSSPRSNSRSRRSRRYEKFRNPASRYAIVGVFVAKTAGGVRVAVTGAGQSGVFRHTAMEQALTCELLARRDRRRSSRRPTG